MNCPSCGRHMSAWSLGPPDHEPAWHCPDCDLTISDDEADEITADIEAEEEKQ
jgi:tRNA(Ile2) C34 agmatinyltransferase TiaS